MAPKQTLIGRVDVILIVVTQTALLTPCDHFYSPCQQWFARNIKSNVKQEQRVPVQQGAPPTRLPTGVSTKRSPNRNPLNKIQKLE